MVQSEKECVKCGALIPKADLNIIAITCWECVAEMVSKFDTSTRKYTPKQEGYPRGWRFMKEFVHADGTVYHKGIEQPALKGTLDPTKQVVKQKKTKAQKKKEAAEIAAQYAQLKKQLRSEKRKTVIKQLERKLKKLEKQL